MRPGDLQGDREQLERGRTPSSEPRDLACSGVRKLRRVSWKVRAGQRSQGDGMSGRREPHVFLGEQMEGCVSLGSDTVRSP